MSWLNSNRDKLERELINSEFRKYISPIYLSQYNTTLPIILQYAHGKLIDLGCGYMPYRNQIIGKVESYDGLDLYPHSKEIKYVTDIQNMSMIPDESYNTAICLEVLEHVPRPLDAIKEIRRILVRGGKVVITVPHMSRLHDVPNDYFRFTSFGLRYMLGEADLEILSVNEKGGILSFLGHQFSIFLLSFVWGFPIIKWIVFFINSFLVTKFLFYSDSLLQTHKLFPAGYIIVGERK